MDKNSSDKSSKVLPIFLFGMLIIGGIYALSISFRDKKTQQQNPPAALNDNVQDSQSVPAAENPTYQHIHSVFKMPDGTILLGAHTGLFKSSDNGKTFVRAQIKSTDTSVNADGEFMNFAYDSANKILYAGTHDSGLLKSTDFGLTWSKTDSGIEGHDIHGLAINPLDTNRIYAYSVDHGLFGTKDGAKTWYKIDDGPKNPNVKGFAYMATPTMMDRNMKKDGSATDIGYLWAGTGGGLFSSFACFCGWTADQAVPQSTTVYALASNPLNKSSMLVAEKDGLYQTTDEGKSFAKINAELKDIGALWFDIQNPKLVLAATNSGIFYTSEDSGASWKKN